MSSRFKSSFSLVWLVLVDQIRLRLKKIEIQRHKDQPVKNRKIGKLTCRIVTSV